jgi:hypothetical protein
MVKERQNPSAFVVIAALLLIFGFAHAADTQKYWVFLKDRGGRKLEKADPAILSIRFGISSKSVENRKKTRPADRIFDETDLPLESRYLTVLEDKGLRISTRSRWLNAVSGYAEKSALESIQSLPFVREVRPVAFYKFVPPPLEKRALARIRKPSLHTLNYGTSEDQAGLIRVPEVHDLGISGKGIVIGMIDAGFDYKNRFVFSKLSVVAEHDFWDGNNNTANEAGDSSTQDEHGTMTLSVIGGFQEGELIGTAYGASFALAKTEWIPFEKKIEEDKWVEGIEWLTDSVGVDVVSSSVGYNTFPGDGRDIGYTYQDLNGRTCVTTIAADAAADRGVVVVNSAGNENQDSWHYIISPADGFNVLAVGAVSLEGTQAPFSSVGPTSDGRTKPDVAALGVGAYCANPDRDDESHFLFANGTSFSCPMAAGVCALVLEAHPGLKPAEVMEALRMTASQADFPDNRLGWGIVNAIGAVFYHGLVFHDPSALYLPFENRYQIEFDVLSNTGLRDDSTAVYWKAGGSESFVRIPAVRFTNVRFRADTPQGADPSKLEFFISARDANGRLSTDPIDAPAQLLSYSGLSLVRVAVSGDESKHFVLHPCYPNPFDGSVHIDIDVFIAGRFEARIFDVLGREVYAFSPLDLDVGPAYVSWDGRDAMGRTVPDGCYLCNVRSGGNQGAVKMIRISGP